MADKSDKARRHLAGYEDGIRGKWLSIYLPVNKDIVEGQKQGYEDYLKNKDLAGRVARGTKDKPLERVVERVVEKVMVVPQERRQNQSSGYDDSCPCLAHKVMAKVNWARASEIRVTGIEWLKKIMSRLGKAKPSWVLYGSCGMIYGTFAENSKVYEVVISYRFNRSFLGDIMPDVAALAFWKEAKIDPNEAAKGKCFDDLLIFEDGKALICYSPNQRQYDKNYKCIDTPERALGRSFFLSIAKPIRDEQELNAAITREVTRKQEELAREENITRAEDFLNNQASLYQQITNLHQSCENGIACYNNGIPYYNNGDISTALALFGQARDVFSAVCYQVDALLASYPGMSNDLITMAYDVRGGAYYAFWGTDEMIRNLESRFFKKANHYFRLSYKYRHCASTFLNS